MFEKQAILDLISICAKKGITHFVLSPGSRCAPLTLTSVRHPEIKTYNIIDERSAAYFALGLARKIKTPVALVCTSGTASLNYAPAIAEAFFQKIPLLVLTADRPAERIAQQDNQSIFQQNIYQNHVAKSFEFPEITTENNRKFAQRISNEAINICLNKQLSVHINCPFQEPLYNVPENVLVDESELKIIDLPKAKKDLSKTDWKAIQDAFNRAKKILILAGYQQKDAKKQRLLSQIAENEKIAVLVEPTSNLANEKFIELGDFILNENNQDLKPDLLISFGGAILSKNIKKYFRKNPPKQHWHISPAAETIDTFQALTKTIPLEENLFFEKIIQFEKVENQESNYQNKFQEINQNFREKIKLEINQSEFCELPAVKTVLENLPSNCDLHLGNSMPIRDVSILFNYKTFQKIKIQKENFPTRLLSEVEISGGLRGEVFANRGTSGIDGVTSTAIGSLVGNKVLEQEKTTVLLTGDLSFFYDSNALWNNYLSPQLKIIVLNNQAGGIFSLVDGANKIPELETHFETPHQAKIQGIAQAFNLNYFFAENEKSLKESLNKLLEEEEKASILEIKIDKKMSQSLLQKLKKLS